MASRRLVVLGAVLAAVLLLLAAPTPAASVRTLAHAGSATDQAAPLVALLALAAWLLAAWLLLVVAVTAGGHLPGMAGRALCLCARRLAPVTVRRALEVALGLTVAVGVLGATPAAAAPGVAGLDVAASSQVAAPGLDWGSPAPAALADPDSVSAAAASAATGPATATVDDPIRSTAPAQDLDWAAQPADPLDAPAQAAPAPTTAPAPAPTAAESDVVVQPGDSLWALAEQDLAARGERTTDASVAQAWPTWWAANRDAVGDDPDLLQPGTRLAPPTGGSTPRASS